MGTIFVRDRTQKALLCPIAHKRAFCARSRTKVDVIVEPAYQSRKQRVDVVGWDATSNAS